MFYGIAYGSSYQVIHTFEVQLSGRYLARPLSIDLDKITFLPDSVLSLTEIMGKKVIPVPM